jgi:hypothetical protein
MSGGMDSDRERYEDKRAKEVNRKISEVLALTQAITILQNESSKAQEVLDRNEAKISDLRVQLSAYLK